MAFSLPYLPFSTAGQLPSLTEDHRATIMIDLFAEGLSHPTRLTIVIITDIEFFNSSNLGTEYTNNLFTGDINNGNLYFFKVNNDRTGLNFEDFQVLQTI